MELPGATRSGFTFPPVVLAVGPLELNDDTASGDLSDDPTVIAFLEVPGLATVPADGPEFPAAITTTAPASTALSAAVERASSGFPVPPRLMLMTFAWSDSSPSPFGSRALSNPARTALSGQLP